MMTYTVMGFDNWPKCFEIVQCPYLGAHEAEIKQLEEEIRMTDMSWKQILLRTKSTMDWPRNDNKRITIRTLEISSGCTTDWISAKISIETDYILVPLRSFLFLF